MTHCHDLKKIKKDIKCLTDIIYKMNQVIHSLKHCTPKQSYYDCNEELIDLIRRIVREEVNNKFIIIEQRLREVEIIMKQYTKKIVQTSYPHTNINNPIDLHACG